VRSEVDFGDAVNGSSQRPMPAAAAMPSGGCTPSWAAGPMAGGGFSEGLIATRHDGSLLAMSDSIAGEVPPLRGRLQLWVAVATIVGEPTVFELKRHRSCRPAHAR
jgi:hypothetical protein